MTKLFYFVFLDDILLSILDNSESNEGAMGISKSSTNSD